MFDNKIYPYNLKTLNIMRNNPQKYPFDNYSVIKMYDIYKKQFFELY